MTHEPPSLLADIDAFLEASQMGESYFGKAAASNSELVPRLRAGGRCWPETQEKVRAFIRERSTALGISPPWEPWEDRVLLEVMVDQHLVKPAMATLKRTQTDCLERFAVLVGPDQHRETMHAALERARAAHP